MGIHTKNIAVAAGTAHSNSLVETAVASYTFPANTFSGSNGYVIHWECLVRATSTNSTDTLTTVAYFGGTTLTTAIASTGAVDAADNDLVHFHGTITIRDADSSGTYVAITHTADLAGTGETEGTELHYTQTASVNFGAALLLEVGCDWSVAHADNSVQAEVFNVRTEVLDF